MNIRTRFAPSPTGFMHLGGLRTALYAYLFAKKNGGKFILRIEDTDRARFVEGATEVIYNTLKECGLNPDEGPDTGGNFAPYIQSERMASGLYMKHALELIEKGSAYYCTCAPDNESCNCKDLHITKPSQPFVIRQRTPDDGETSFSDEVYGEITVPNSEIEDQVLVKSDGMPTYNFANVIDDHTMSISHVIRGNEFLSSTPKHVLLYKAFGWEPPIYIHAAPIMRDESHKLSKRDGDAYFSDFRRKGYLTEAIVNYIALLGWSPVGENAEQEIFSLSELTEAFDVKGISKSPAIFDEVKMRAINAQYIRALEPQAFKQLAIPYILAAAAPDGAVANDGNSAAHMTVVLAPDSKTKRLDIDFDILCAALQPRVEVLNDITPQVDFVFGVCDYQADLYNNKKMKTTPETAKTALADALEVISSANFTRDDIYEAFKALSEQKGVKIGAYLYPLQVALTGKPAAPGGGLDICVMLGKAESLKRIETAINKLENVL